MNDLLKKLEKKSHLTKEESAKLMQSLISGEELEQDILRALKLLNDKALTTMEMIGFLESLKRNARSINFENHELIDICGTGGTQKTRFNISTCVAFVLAAAGVGVVKHGNVGSRKPNGSFNFLQELGIEYDLSNEQLIHMFQETSCCFLFAKVFHPMMKHVASARKLLAARSVFNLLGPLANPSNITYQLLGCPNFNDVHLLADVIKQLKRKKAWVIVGGDERDEISLAGDNYILEISNEGHREFQFNFQKEIEVVNDSYSCGDSKYNAHLFENILIKKDWSHSVIKHISINAAAAFMIVGKVDSLMDGYSLALSYFKKGIVTQTVNKLKDISRYS